MPTASFNKDVGFEKLDFTNINYTKLAIELLAYSNDSYGYRMQECV